VHHLQFSTAALTLIVT